MVQEQKYLLKKKKLQAYALLHIATTLISITVVPKPVMGQTQYPRTQDQYDSWLPQFTLPMYPFSDIQGVREWK